METQQKRAYILKFYLWTLFCPLRPDLFFSGFKDPIPSFRGLCFSCLASATFFWGFPLDYWGPLYCRSRDLKVPGNADLTPCRFIIHDCLVGQSDIQLVCLEKVKTLRFNLYPKCPTRPVQDFSWHHTLSEIILLKPSLPCPFSSTLLLVSPGSTSLINNLHLNPCLRICFWGAVLMYTSRGRTHHYFFFPCFTFCLFFPPVFIAPWHQFPELTLDHILSVYLLCIWNHWYPE